jgi:hypothetical protein
MRNHHLEDHSIRIGEHVLAVDIPPFIALGRAAQVVCAPVINPLPAIPIFVPDMFALLPLVVPDVLGVMVLVSMLLLIVMMVLGDRSSTAKRNEQCTRRKALQYWFHISSPLFRQWCLSMLSRFVFT